MLRAIMIFLAGLAAASAALAGSPFEITGVRIDAYGANATKAQEQAIRGGTLDATYQLLDRLTLPSDRLALDPPLIITEDVAEQLVAGIEIANEKRSRSRYLGDLSVTFDAQSVRSFLRAHNLPFVESQAASVLIVPIWQNAEGQSVLSTDNPFAKVLTRPGFQNHLVPLKLAKENADMDEEETSLKAWQLANLDADLLSAMAAEAGVKDIIMATTKKAGPSSVRIRAQRIRIGETGVESIEDMGSFEGVAPSSARQSQWLAQALFLAADKIAQVLDTNWKHQAIVRDDMRQSVRLTALYNNLSQWQRLRDALGGMALVEEARLDALSYDGALLTLNYIGSEEQLARRLAQKGIILSNEDIGLVARIQ